MAEKEFLTSGDEWLDQAESVLYSIWEEKWAVYNDPYARGDFWGSGVKLTAHGKKQCNTAIQYCNNALALNSDSPRAWYVKGKSYYLINNYFRGIQCFDKTLMKEPYNVDALGFKGVCIGKMNFTSPSLRCFDEALRIDPGNDFITEQRELVWAMRPITMAFLELPGLKKGWIILYGI